MFLKSVTRRYSIFLLFLVFNGFVINCYSQWVQQEFVIGTFIDPSPDHTSYTADSAYLYKLRAAKDAYFNLLTGMGFKREHYDKTFLKYKFLLLKDYKIKTLYLGDEFFNLNAFNSNKQKLFDFRSSLDVALDTTLEGYFLVDEPSAEWAGNIRSIVSTLKLNDPQRFSYVNLLPSYAFDDKKKYEEYLDSYLNFDSDKTRNLEVVSYDFYPFVRDGELRPDYFYNLSIIREKAAGRPFWTYVNTTAHGSYPDPDEYQLNFTSFCPLAYGTRGVLYFTYETIQNSSTGLEFGDAIIGKDKKMSPKYYTIQKINHFLSKVAGPIVINSQLMGVYHVSGKGLNEKLSLEVTINSDMPVIAKVGNDNMLFGVYTRKQTPKNFDVILINKSRAYQKDVFMTFRGDVREKLQVSIHIRDLGENTALFRNLKGEYDPVTNETRVFLDFNPGEARAIKVSGVNDPYEKIINPTTKDLIIYPNPVENLSTASFTLLSQGLTSLEIYSPLGQKVKTLIDRITLPPGRYYEKFDMNGLGEGVYSVILTNGKYRIHKKILVKNR